MALISIDNGNSETEVANLTDEDVAHALDVGHLDGDLREAVHNDLAEGATDRDFLNAYCEAHSDKFDGEVFTIG